MSGVFLWTTGESVCDVSLCVAEQLLGLMCSYGLSL